MFHKYKWIKQENIRDCGIACLLTIIRMYKGNIPLEKLRYLTKTGKDGTTAFHLIEAAKQLGFEAKGYQCTNLEIISKLPCIAHVIINGSFQHYVVIQNINNRNRQLIMSDPVTGTKKVSFDDFYKIWSKIIISLIPIKKITIIKNNNYFKKMLLKLLMDHWKKLLLIVILSFIYILFSIGSTLYLKVIADNYHTSIHKLYYLFYFFSIITLLRVISDFIRNKMLIYINKEVDQTIMFNTYNHLISLPYSYFQERHTGDIISRINDLSYVRELISRISLTFFVDFILVIFSLFILYYINHTLFFLSFFFLILYLLIVSIFNPKLKSFINNMQESQAHVTMYMVESISNINTIKGLNIEANIISKSNQKYTSLINTNYLFDKTYNRQKSLKDIILLIGFNTIFFVGSTLVYQHQISLSNLILFNSLLVYFWEPIRGICDLEPLIKNAFNSIKRINNIYDVEKEEFSGEIEVIKGDIRYNHLTFSYNNVTNILDDINLIIKQGERVLVLGSSGSGKSTLFKLLMKYYNVNNDSITINNKYLNNYSLSSIRNSICYVAQDERLFNDTIINNIILYRRVIDDEFNKVCEIVKINDILKNRNIDYNYQIEENGANLSGGERQRLIIARSLLKKANIYIFDESMNELDLNMEREIFNNIKNEYSDKTIIVISHRLENKDLYNKIITINKGKTINMIDNERGINERVKQ